MTTSHDHPMLALLEGWTQHFGYYDNRIDLKVDRLGQFVTTDAKLIAHAPLWGIKEGYQAFPAAQARKRLARALRFGRATRHHMQLALHPDGMQLCLFFGLKTRLRLLPITLQTTTLAFIVLAVETEDGLRIEAVHEWAAADPAEARQVVIDHHGWPVETTLTPHVAFGAVS